MEQKLKNSDIAIKVTELYDHRVDSSLRILTELLDLLIREARELNDRIDPVELKENQGKIEAYQKIKRYVQSGLEVPAQFGIEKRS